MNSTYLAEQLRAAGCRVQIDEPMSAHTSFRIGGVADLFVVAQNERQLADIQALCARENIPMMIIGNGSNLLVSDEGIEGVVVQLESTAPVFAGTTVTAFAGMTLSRLCVAACEKGLAGLEFAYGIPGTVGGGVYMNAGAYGGELSQVIDRVGVLTQDGTVKVLDKTEMEFGYRHSLLMEQRATVLWVELTLTPDDAVAIRQRMDDILQRRRDKQPLEYPSGGSFFKRPTGYFAGALIEQCGLKGVAVGDAQVSEKHAGFVINRGKATCADVMALCRLIQQTVRDAHGVELEREVQLIGRGC